MSSDLKNWNVELFHIRYCTFGSFVAWNNVVIWAQSAFWNKASLSTSWQPSWYLPKFVNVFVPQLGTTYNIVQILSKKNLKHIISCGFVVRQLRHIRIYMKLRRKVHNAAKDWLKVFEESTNFIPTFNLSPNNPTGFDAICQDASYNTFRWRFLYCKGVFTVTRFRKSWHKVFMFHSVNDINDFDRELGDFLDLITCKFYACSTFILLYWCSSELCQLADPRGLWNFGRLIACRSCGRYHTKISCLKFTRNMRTILFGYGTNIRGIPSTSKLFYSKFPLQITGKICKLWIGKLKTPVCAGGMIITGAIFNPLTLVPGIVVPLMLALSMFVTALTKKFLPCSPVLMKSATLPSLWNQKKQFMGALACFLVLLTATLCGLVTSSYMVNSRKSLTCVNICAKSLRACQQYNSKDDWYLV